MNEYINNNNKNRYIHMHRHILNVRFAVCGLRFAVYGLRFAVCILVPMTYWILHIEKVYFSITQATMSYVICKPPPRLRISCETFLYNVPFGDFACDFLVTSFFFHAHRRFCLWNLRAAFLYICM